MVPPNTMCRKHLLGEHVEIHMAIGALKKGKSLAGFLNKRLLEIHSLYSRHEALAHEMLLRGYQHQSELPQMPLPYETATVDVAASWMELKRRCAECKKLSEG